MICKFTGFSEVHIFLLFLVMASYDVISCQMAFKFVYFVELTMGYQLAKFECCRFPGSIFTEGLKKKKQLQRHSDVISYCWASKFAYFVKLNIGY